jgi:hypothetical protein
MTSKEILKEIKFAYKNDEIQSLKDLLTKKNLLRLEGKDRNRTTLGDLMEWCLPQIFPYIKNDIEILKFNIDPCHKYTALHDLAQKGYLKKISPEILTPNLILNTKNEDDDTPLHWAAYYKQLKNTPQHLFTEKLCTLQGFENITVIHYAAENDEIKFLPKEILTQKNIEKKDDNHNTVFHFLLGGKNKNKLKLTEIPPELINTSNLLALNSQDLTPLDLTITHHELELIPEKIITSEVLNTTTINKIIHQIITHGELHKINPEIITEKLLLTQSLSGDNCFHIAARNSTLNKIPRKFLTIKNLTQEDNNKKTAIFRALNSGSITQLPHIPWATIEEIANTNTLLQKETIEKIKKEHREAVRQELIGKIKATKTNPKNLTRT